MDSPALDPWVLALTRASLHPLDHWERVHSVLGHRSDWPEIAQYALDYGCSPSLILAIATGLLPDTEVNA